jgi:hypothetical protein
LPRLTKSLTFFFLPIALCAQAVPGVSDTGTSLPAYRAFFHQVYALYRAEQSATAAEAAELRALRQKHIGLTQEEDDQVKQLAAVHVAAVDAIEAQARQVIQAHHAQFPSGRVASQHLLPAPAAELADLQAQRDTLTKSHIQALRSSLSANSFAKLDAWVKSNFNQKVSKPAPSRPAPPRQGGGK